MLPGFLEKILYQTGSPNLFLPKVLYDPVQDLLTPRDGGHIFLPQSNTCVAFISQSLLYIITNRNRWRCVYTGLRIILIISRGFTAYLFSLHFFVSTSWTISIELENLSSIFFCTFLLPVCYCYRLENNRSEIILFFQKSSTTGFEPLTQGHPRPVMTIIQEMPW